MRPASAELDASVARLKKQLKSESFNSSYEIAETTAKLARKIITDLKWKKIQVLISYLKEIYRDLRDEKLTETAIACNVLLRIIKIVSNEDSSAPESSEQLMSGMMQKLDLTCDAESNQEKQSASRASKMRNSYADCVTEYIDELENSSSNIASQSLEHIHSNEIILTIGFSRTVGVFLQEAARTRSFQVLIAESAPSFKGHELAKSLLDCNISVTVIPDSNIFAVMSRVNKVIIGCKLILADGSLISSAGSQLVAQAAAHFSVPVVVLGAFYKITPTYLSLHDQEIFNTLSSPELVLPPRDVGSTLTRAVNPVFDFVPSEYLTLLISSTAGHDPSYLSKLIFDLYPKLE